MKQKKALKKTVTFKIELEAAKLAQKAAIDNDTTPAKWIAEAIRIVYNQPKKVTQVQIGRECDVSGEYINQVIKRLSKGEKRNAVTGKLFGRPPSKKVLSTVKRYHPELFVTQGEVSGQKGRHDSGV